MAGKEKYENLEAWIKETLGVSDTFFNQLDKDDDWTLIIKLHTMIEGGLIHLLLTRLEAPRLAKAIARLETGNQQTGKLAFVNAFELLPSEECRFIQILCELRNICAHDVRSFHFGIKAYVDAFDDKKAKIWRKDFEFLQHEFRGNIWLNNIDVIAEPRAGILAATGTVMASIRASDKALHLKRENVSPPPPSVSTPKE